MKMPTKDGHPPVFTLKMLQRANMIGITFFGVLLGIAAVVFLLLDVIGVSSTPIHALVALLVSPLIFTVLAGFGWLAMRANKSNLATNHEVENDG